MENSDGNTNFHNTHNKQFFYFRFDDIKCMQMIDLIIDS